MEDIEFFHFYQLDLQQVLGLEAGQVPVQVADGLLVRLQREDGGGWTLQEEVGVGLLVGPSRHRIDPKITGSLGSSQVRGERRPL